MTPEIREMTTCKSVSTRRRRRPTGRAELEELGFAAWTDSSSERGQTALSIDEFGRLQCGDGVSNAVVARPSAFADATGSAQRLGEYLRLVEDTRRAVRTLLTFMSLAVHDERLADDSKERAGDSADDAR